MKALTWMYVILGMAATCCMAVTGSDDYTNANELQRLRNMDRITINAGVEMEPRIRVFEDGCIRFSGLFPDDLVELEPGTCDMAALIRKLDGVDVRPESDVRADSWIQFTIDERAEGRKRLLYPKNPAAALDVIRRLFAKVPPGHQRDTLRTALVRAPLVRDRPIGQLEGNRLAKLLTPGQDKALREWLAGAPDFIRSLESVESPELSQLFGGDSFLRLSVGVSPWDRNRLQSRMVLIYEGKFGVKVWPEDALHDAVAELLGKAGQKIESEEDAKLAGGAFASIHRIQTIGYSTPQAPPSPGVASTDRLQPLEHLEVEKHADGFTVKWQKCPPPKKSIQYQLQERLPLSVRFRRNEEGRVLKAEPTLPEPAQKSEDGK